MEKPKPKKDSKSPAKKIQPKAQELPEDDEKPFDFGGLPDRDLKKNLGCGG